MLFRSVDSKEVFNRYRIDEQLAKALDRKVWLPSGGSLVIDRTEAMTVVDVNTGKFIGQGGNLEQTVTKNNSTAASYYAAAIKTDPQYGPALYNLAIIKTANGDEAGAIELYKRAIAADPTDANANLNLGFLLYETGDKTGADSAFRKAIALNPALKQRIPSDQQPVG